MRYTLNLLSYCLWVLLYAANTYADTLGDAWRAARIHSAEYRSADYARIAAQEVSDQAKAQLLPHLSASAEHKRFSADHDAYSQDLRIQVSQPLFNRPRWNTYEAAQLSAKQADSEFQNKDSQLLLDVSKAYLSILATRDKLRAVKAEKASYIKQIERAKALFSAGEATILDTYEAEAGLDAAKAKVLSLETEKQLAENQYADLTGLNPVKITPIQDKALPDFAGNTQLSDWIDKALNNNAVLSAQRLALAKSKRDVKVAEAEHWPQLSLTAGYQDSHTFRHGSKQKDHGAYVGISFTIPIYSGGETSSKVRQSEAIAAQQQAMLDSTSDRIRLNVKQAWAMLAGQKAQIRVQQQLLKSNIAKLEATHLGRTYGIRHSMDEIQAEQAYAEAQEKLAAARYSYIEAWLTLLHISGELTQLTEIDSIYTH